MSYQEIYKGLHKSASAEQVKELAVMLKKASMQKKAALKKEALPGWVRTLGAPARFVGNQFTKHPKILTAALTAIPSTAIGLTAGNSGKGKLREDLAKSNQKVKNLTAENEKLNNRGVWDLISENFGKFWQWLSDYFSGKQGNKPDTNKVK